MECTFSLLVGGECGADPKSKTASRKIVPLVSCSKNISSHKKQLQFSGCETEIELILARSGCFQTPENIHDMTICPLHHVSLGGGEGLSGYAVFQTNSLDTVKNPRKMPSGVVAWLSRSTYWKPLVNSFQLVQVNIILLLLYYLRE